jgi:hypothetical protein
MSDDFKWPPEKLAHIGGQTAMDFNMIRERQRQNQGPTIFMADRERTTNQMRIELDELTYRGCSEGWGEQGQFGLPPPSANVARRILDLSRREGLTGEDKYTVLAYMALREVDRLSKLVLDFHATKLPDFVVKP